jgi:HEAT repeat protein
MQQQRILFIAKIVILLGGCTSTSERLRNLIDENRYTDAATIAADDSAVAVELSAIVLERAARSEEHMDRALKSLSAAGRSGQAALKQLSRGDAVSARAARIAYDRFDKPSDETLALCNKDPHPLVRWWCVSAWVQFMSDEMMTELLSDMDPEVRLFALRGLAALPAEPTRAPLFVDALRLDPDEKVRAEAALHGDLLGDDALLLLKDRLSDQHLGIRTAAVSGIARINTEAACALLTSVAGRQGDQVALRAQAELAGLGNATGRTLLLQRLDDEQPSIRAAALYLLFNAKIEDASALIVNHLEDKDPEVVLAASNLLRNDEDSRDKVLKALQKVSSLKSKASPRADDLLAAMGDEQAANRILKALKDANKVGEKELISALHRVFGVTAACVRTFVVSLLGDPREKIRIEAAYTVLFSMSKI